MLPLLLLLRLLLTLFGLAKGEAGTETSRTGTLLMSLDCMTGGAITGGDQPPTAATAPEEEDTGAGAVIGVVDAAAAVDVAVDAAASVGCGGG